jgi:hypothetical protein
MADKKKADQIKLYAVVGLAAAAAVLAYVRFGPKALQRGGSGPDPAPPPSGVQIPVVDLSLYRLPSSGTAGNQADFQPALRDIFAEIPADRPATTNGPQEDVEIAGLRLKGIMRGSRRSMANINDQLLAEGEQVGRYTVASIAHDRVVLTWGDERVTLEIAPGPLLRYGDQREE